MADSGEVLREFASVDVGGGVGELLLRAERGTGEGEERREERRNWEGKDWLS